MIIVVARHLERAARGRRLIKGDKMKGGTLPVHRITDIV